MKKPLLVMVGLAFSATMYSQIGVNTTDPKATLDVVGKTTDGTHPEGIIAPRLTGDALFAASSGTTPQYGVDQDGTIVYVTAAVSPGNDTGQTVNIDIPGYYYFDAADNQWKKVSESIYITNGTLTEARTMDMNSSTMGFVNGRVSVGINASDPASAFEIQSTTGGFLPPRMTRAQVDAIAFPPPGLVVYCTDFLGAGKGCLMVNDSVDPSVPEWGSMCSSNATTPIVLILDCASTVTTGSLFSGQPASGVSSSVPYSGGNGGAYQAASFSSTGVTGLVANLPGGVLNTGNGNLVFNITGTPAAAGTATFTITVAGQSCSFTVPVTASTAIVGSLNCATAAFSPATLTQGTAYSGTLTIPYTGGNGAAYPQQSQTVNGLTFTLPAGTLNTGNGNLAYTVSGTPAAPGAMSVPINFGGQSCSFTVPVTASTAIVGSLNCATAAFSPATLTQGTAYSGTLTIPYTGGNGAAYPQQSQTVNGLTFTLPAGTLNTGNGNLVFNITGTPAAAGTATFTITVAGQSCSFTVPVTASTAIVGSLNCATAAFSPATLTQGTAYSGTLTIPYTGGNGAAYPQQSQTVNGLTFTLPAGTLNTGNGNLAYTVSGTPAAPGAMSVPINFGGQSCNVNTTVTTGTTVVLPGNPEAWMRYNLGADTSLDPDQNPSVIGLQGNYYQWGSPAVVANASTPAGAIGGWNTANAPNNSWQDATKTANDPCPAGFRVPTSQQFMNLINSNTTSNIGTFTNSATNYGSAKVFGSGTNMLTLPAAGFRYYPNGTLDFRGAYGYYWSSTQDTATSAYYLNVNSTSVTVYSNPLAGGFNIRCISE